MALDRRSHAVLWEWRAKDKSWVLPQLLYKTRDTPKRPELKWGSVFLGRIMIEIRTYMIASPRVSIANDGIDTATAGERREPPERQIRAVMRFQQVQGSGGFISDLLNRME